VVDLEQISDRGTDAFYSGPLLAAVSVYGPTCRLCRITWAEGQGEKILV
jgi:hypothetical protein